MNHSEKARPPCRTYHSRCRWQSSQTPQEYSVAERTNRRLKSCVRVSVDTARVPFDKYWVLFLLDSTVKAYWTFQRTIQDVSRKLWDKYRQSSAHSLESRCTSNSFACSENTDTCQSCLQRRRSETLVVYSPYYCTLSSTRTTNVLTH